MKKLEGAIGAGTGKQLRGEELINSWESLSYKEKEKKWNEYQNALKDKFEKNKKENIASGDYSYFEQLYSSGQEYNKQMQNNLNNRVNEINQNNAGGLILIFSIIVLLISLVKK